VEEERPATEATMRVAMQQSLLLSTNLMLSNLVLSNPSAGSS